MSFTEEVEPLETLKDLLEDNWESFLEVPLPNIIIVNDPEEAISRVNLMDGDVVMLSMAGNEDIRMRGNFSYYDRVFPLALNILTKESRQRMRNIFKVIRSICFMKKHNFTGYQLIRLLTGCTELVNQDLNIWRGTVRLQVENHAIRTETSI